MQVHQAFDHIERNPAPALVPAQVRGARCYSIVQVASSHELRDEEHTALHRQPSLIRATRPALHTLDLRLATQNLGQRLARKTTWRW